MCRNVDAVPVGTPCPACDSLARDATVTPDAVAAAVALVYAPPIWTGTVTTGIEALLARPNVDPIVRDRTQRRAEELAVGSTVRTIVFHDPGEGGTVVCDARDDGGNILDAKPGRDAADALLAVAEALLPDEPECG